MTVAPHSPEDAGHAPGERDHSDSIAATLGNGVTPLSQRIASICGAPERPCSLDEQRSEVGCASGRLPGPAWRSFDGFDARVIPSNPAPTTAKPRAPSRGDQPR